MSVLISSATFPFTNVLCLGVAKQKENNYKSAKNGYKQQ